MPQTDISGWLQFALQQMAAESYLNGFQFTDSNTLIRRLKLGNNNTPTVDPDLNPDLDGKTRFISTQAQEFVSHYQIIDHHANDATGFSATLIKDLSDPTGKTFTLSFRSVEYQNQVDGGDWQRDGLPGAAGEIVGTGFALAQLVSMEKYYQELKADPTKLPPGAILNVTGYSLGGHLATVFTQLHANEITATYTFNGAGRGQINGGTPGLSETERIREMLQFAEIRLEAIDPSWFASGNMGNVYEDQRYRDVRQDTVTNFNTTNSFLPPGEIGTAPGFDKITQLVGQATHNDQPYVANSGIHATPTMVFIEDQPNVDGLGGLFGQSGSFGTTHSITLIVDSLALMELFQQVDGMLEQATLEGIFAAASSQTGSGVVGLAGLAEGNSLENALDALGKILVPNYTPTPFGRQTNDFGNLTFRNPFYVNLEAIKAAVGMQSYQIVSFATKRSSEISTAARSADATGLAYRYALQELNPFAVVGADYSVHNPQGPDGGPLDLYNAQTGQGTWTALALSDRAELLSKRLEYNLSDGDTVQTDTHYLDLQSGFEVGSTSSTSEVIFGDDRVGDVLIGHAGDDHLYGRDGADTIEGNGGRDYIEGGVGNDPRLSGGAGDDIILGQQGNDQLFGEADNDRLNGGLGDDLLDGGTGLDTYFYRTGQGLDRIVDADKIGTIVFDNQTLAGGIHREGAPADTYTSPDGQFTYVKQGADLVIKGVLTIQNFDFATGMLGIKLADASDLVDNAGPTINYVNGQPSVRYDGDATDNIPNFTAAANHEAYGFGGNDILNFEGGSAAFNHQLFGGDGHDELHGGAGQDRIYGEAGRDLIFAVEGDDVIDGGGDIDLIKGGLGQDVLSGGLGNDGLDGGSDDDVLFGGDGNDVLSGESVQLGATTTGDDYLGGEAGDDWVLGLRGDDVLYGGTGTDHLYGDQVTSETPNFELTYPGIVTTVPGVAFASTTGGADYLDGEEGDDYLQGDAGDDILLGGADNDELWGDDQQIAVIQEGADWLEGEGGNDQLVGGGGEDALFGGDGDDILVGDYANNAVLGFDDTLDGGAGIDELQGGGGSDLLLGGTETDRLFGEAGDDVLDGGQGADELQGGDGADLLDGGTENDRLFGQAGDDDLAGGAGDDLLVGDVGNDFLDGEAGADQLVGGAGSDILDGGTGSDVYVYNLGDGQDVFNDVDLLGDTNTIIFGPGITLADLLLTPDSAQQTLTIQVGAGSDAIRVLGFDPNALQYGIQTLAFADGSQVALVDLLPLPSGFVTGNAAGNVIRTGSGDDTIDAAGGDDSIDAGAGNDRLIGGTGNDTLTGGAGDDTYVFNLGDGVDAINDSAVAGAGNRVVFGGGITPGHLKLGLGSGLQVQVGTSGDALTLSSFNPNDAWGLHAIDQFQFADGTTLSYAQLLGLGFDIDGTEGFDFLSGTSVNDRINGRGGPDSIDGNAGDDTIDAGTGNDSVNAGDGNDSVSGGAGNDVLSGGSGNDTLVGGEGNDVLSGGADNDTLVGEEGNDTLRGGSGNDQLLGGAGDDVMYGEGGNEFVDGGSGNDRLVGAPGTYTYVFGTGSGQDIIESSQGGTYTIQMSAGVLPSDVIVGRVDQTITLSLNGGFDTLTLPSFYVNHSLQVQFANGTVWDAATIHNQAGDSRQVGTSEADFLLGYNGFPDELIGLAGDDVYTVNDLGDVVVEAPNEGHDTVYSSVDFTLPDNVEDLYLVEPFALYELIGSILLYVDPAALVAMGNALDNVLHGNGYDNVITGGAGDDTLYGGLAYLGGTVSTSDKDILDGGAGDDTYLYQEWSGVDTILDDSSTGDVNQVRAFNVFVDSDHLSLTVKGGALTLVFTGVDDSSAVEKSHELRIPNFDPNDAYGRHAIDLFTFTTPFTGIETTLTYSQLIDRGIDVYGTNQDDIVTGTNAPNRFHGGAGNDTLLGGARNDIYFYDRGDGVDTIVDTAVAGAMNEIRFGTGLNLGDLEVVQGTNVLTLQVGSNGDAIVLSNYDPTGQTGSSVIGSVTFANGIHLTLDELLNFPGGTDGDDSFIGTDGVDRYDAKGGNDVVTGGGGSDLLLGGSGQDDLKGDAGDDQLFGGTGDDQLHGGVGTDELGGGYGNDTLTGGIGDDILDGGDGADVYVFNRGDGHDVIRDRAESAGNNRLLFGPGITLSDLNWSVDYGGQFGVNIDGVNTIINRIYIAGFDEYVDLPNVRDVAPALRTISFADGLTLDLFDYYAASLVQADQNLVAGTGDATLIGGAGNDTLQGGAGNSALIGGGGNNTLIGGTGRTTFYSQSAANNLVFFGTGSNVLVIPGGASSNTVHALGAPASNTVVFGGGYNSFNPNLWFGSLLIRYGSEGGELHIEGFDPNDAYANPGIGTFQFTDRTLTYQELIDLGFNILGTDEANVLTGSSATDRIKGLSGNDTLQSGLGADVLEGGQGDDLLSGGLGTDTYVFNVGDGIDTIQDVTGAGEGNPIQFGVGIAQTDLTFTQDQVARTLTIQVGSSGTDQLVLANFDPTGANGSLVVDTLAFADGSSMNLADLFPTAVNHAPTLANVLADQTVQEDAPFSVVVPSNVFADEDAGDVLTLSASMANGTALPSWLTFDATTATFNGTPDDAQVGSLDLRVTATDHENLSVSDVFTLTVTNVNEAPTVATPLANQTAVEDTAFTFAVPESTFADVDSGDVLAYSVTLADGTALPTWLSFNSTTRTFSGTPLNSHVGTLALTVTAMDQGSLSASTGFTLAIQNVNDAPTVAVPIADHTTAEDSTFTLTIPSATFADEDVIHGDVLTYSATLADGSALPAWLSFTPSTHTFSGTPVNANVGSLAVTVTATDTGTLNASDTFSLTVTNVNDAPTVATPIVDQAALTGAAFTFTVPTNTFADVDLGDQLTYSAILADGSALPAWLSFNGTTRAFSGTPSSGDAGLVNIKVTATDSGSLSAADVFALTVTIQDQILTGTAGNDVLTGGAGNDQLFGLAGNDTLQGGIGHDLLDGGTGTDTMQGGMGHDTYIVDVTGDVVTELANEGTDTVQSSVTYTLSANVENLTLTGTANLNGTGNALDNILTGNSGANVLTGGAGNDTYIVGAGDSVAESLNSGTDTVQSAVTWTLGSTVENLTLTGTANINGNGSSANNVLIGNSGNNTLDSGSGNDTADGGEGNDSLLGGSGDDQLLGGIGDDTLNAGSGNDVLNGGDGTDTLDGGSGDDQLLGGAGNDTLTGGSGADQFTGGTGNDALTGGSGNDLYNFSRGDGQDTISDSDPFSGNQDRALFGITINPLDLVISRQANDLRLAIHGSSDQITVQNWYLSTNNQIETIQAGNGQTLLSTQVDQLIQAMAGFTQQTGLTWDQAIDQQPQDVQTVLAASWQ